MKAGSDCAPIATLTVPSVSADQMREVDRLMIEETGVTLVQMMENAGRNLAHVARCRFLERDARGKRVLVLCGPGGNGGGGLVSARRLHNWGADVHVLLSGAPEKLGDVPRHQLGILDAMGIQAKVAVGEAELSPADLIIDALVGYSLRGAPEGVAAALVRSANGHSAPILALDVPTGLDATSGAVREPAIRAAATMTLALPKEGLDPAPTHDMVGELYLADIGVPPSLYAELGLQVGPVFARADVVRLR